MIVLGFAMFALERHRLATARVTENFVVTTATPGLSAMEAERNVAVPLERALSQVKGVEDVRSTSTAGFVFIVVRATAIGVDSRGPAELAQQAVSRVLPQLPPDLSPPMIMRLEEAQHTRHWVAHSETLSRLELSTWLDQVFTRKLEVQRGVREVKRCGAVGPEVKVTLDQTRIRALGLQLEDVVRALRLSSLTPPGGRLGAGLQIRQRGGSLEALAATQLKGSKLRDVATLELGAQAPRCQTAKDIFISVSTFDEATALKLEAHPAVKVTPFTAVRRATFLNSGAPLQALAQAYPDAVITREDDLVTMLTTTELAFHEVPGFALRSVDGPHTVVRIFGPDFDELTDLAAKLRALLAKARPRWLGVAWPQLAPERVITPGPGERDVAQLLRLAVGGVETGELDDGTPVRVVTGAALEDLLMADGRPLRDVVQITAELQPAAILRVNGLRAVELEVGLAPSDVMGVVKAFPLPVGYAANAVESN